MRSYSTYNIISDNINNVNLVKRKMFDSTKLYLGKICSQNHDYNNTGRSLRNRHNGLCPICEQHPQPTIDKAELSREKKREKTRRYYRKNKEKIIEHKREYVNQNREKVLQKRKEYRENNKEKIARQRRIYRKANKKQLKKARRLYYEKNRESILEKQKARYIKKREGKNV